MKFLVVLHPFVFWIFVRKDSDAVREYSHPYSPFFVDMNVLDDVTVHLIGIVLVGRQVGLQVLGYHVQFVDTVSVSGNQYLVIGVIGGSNGIDGYIFHVADVLQCSVGLIVDIESVHQCSYDQRTGWFMVIKMLDDMEILQQ